MIASYLTAFLRRLEADAPPPAGCHHAVMLFRYGSESEGWEERLGVLLNRGGAPQKLFFDDGDLELAPTDLTAAVIRAADATCPS